MYHRGHFSPLLPPLAVKVLHYPQGISDQCGNVSPIPSPQKRKENFSRINPSFKILYISSSFFKNLITSLYSIFAPETFRVYFHSKRQQLKIIWLKSLNLSLHPNKVHPYKMSKFHRDKISTTTSDRVFLNLTSYLLDTNILTFNILNFKFKLNFNI